MKGIRSFPKGICQPTEGIRNLPNGICQPTECTASFCTGIFQLTEGTANICTSIFRKKVGSKGARRAPNASKCRTSWRIELLDTKVSSRSFPHRLQHHIHAGQVVGGDVLFLAVILANAMRAHALPQVEQQGAGGVLAWLKSSGAAPIKNCACQFARWGF